MSSGATEAGKEGSSGGRAAALLNQPIVMDVGSCTTKAGFAGGSKPKVSIGTKVGVAKHTRVMPGGALEQEPTSVFVGSKLEDHRGAFFLDYPMSKGCVSDDAGWDAMERIWEHVYSKACLSAKMEDHPVLLTECPLNPKTHRERMAELFFDTFRVPAVCVAPPAVLSLYASGRTTGAVLDVGDGVAHCIPVYEGYALQHSITRSDIAGRDVTNYLKLLLRRGPGIHFTTTAEHDLCQTIKEQVCYLRPTTTNNSNNSNSNKNSSSTERSEVPYQLPDGQTIQLSEEERCRAPEILLDPSLVGSEEMGVADIVSSSIAKSDLDLRSILYSQIVLAGGSTHTPGFGDRFLAELRARVPAHTRIRISAPPERIHSAWAGGSILASLSTFKHMWVTAAEYEEYGSSILQTRGSL